MTIPEAAQEREWMSQMLELYAQCSIINRSCSQELLHQKLNKE